MERIPWILKIVGFRRDVLFRAGSRDAKVYLTFDDGPIPESTPHLLRILSEAEAKATFFMVADNARRYPDLLRAVVAAGHSVGNHTFHHRPPFRESTARFLEDVALADDILHSRLFRPPHGLIRRRQQRALSDDGYQVVMFDLNTLDYLPDRSPQEIFDSVKRKVRPGSVINFHDSLKSIGKLRVVLPEILNLLRTRGYRFETL